MNMYVRMGDNGWPGIFIPGDAAIFGADVFDALANLEATPSNIDIMRGAFRTHAKQLRACYVKDRDTTHGA